MSKQIHEIAADITQEVVKARGQAINGVTSGTSHYIEKYLSDEAVASLYQTILDKIDEQFQ